MDFAVMWFADVEGLLWLPNCCCIGPRFIDEQSTPLAVAQPAAKKGIFYLSKIPVERHLPVGIGQINRLIALCFKYER